MSGLKYEVWVDQGARLAWFLERRGGGIHRWLGVNKNRAYKGQAYPYITPGSVKHESDENHFREWWHYVDQAT